jgi:hypothetical protein
LLGFSPTKRRYGFFPKKFYNNGCNSSALNYIKSDHMMKSSVGIIGKREVVALVFTINLYSCRSHILLLLLLMKKMGIGNNGEYPNSIEKGFKWQKV